MILNNSKNILRFTESLNLLFVERKMDFISALEVMKKLRTKGNDKVCKSADFIKTELEKGNMPAAAFRLCPFICFDEIFVSFMNVAEKSGNLRETVLFLLEKYRRRKNCCEKLLAASVYPVFVIFLSFAVCALLWNYGKTMLGEEKFNTEMKIMLLKSLFFLLLFTVSVFLILRNRLGEDRLYESFLAAGFLIKSGVNAATAIGLAATLAGGNTKIREMFLAAKVRMEYGMDLVRAFSAEAEERKLLKGSVLDALYFAEKSGGKNDIFERLAEHFFSEDEKRKKMWLQLSEPIFIAGTGIFLILLIGNFLIPVMSEMNFFV